MCLLWFVFVLCVFAFVVFVFVLCLCLLCGLCLLCLCFLWVLCLMCLCLLLFVPCLLCVFEAQCRGRRWRRRRRRCRRQPRGKRQRHSALAQERQSAGASANSWRTSVQRVSFMFFLCLLCAFFNVAFLCLLVCNTTRRRECSPSSCILGHPKEPFSENLDSRK